MIGLIIAAIGAAYSAYSKSQSGKANNSLANYNADVTLQAANHNADVTEQSSAYNAMLAELEGKTAVSEGLAQSSVLRRQGGMVLASQRAKRAASGVVGGTGSPLAVELAQTGYAEMRALEASRLGMNRGNQLQQAADLERTRGKASADYLRWQGNQQATIDRMGGSAAKTAGNMEAGATILQGAGNAYSGYQALS